MSAESTRQATPDAGRRSRSWYAECGLAAARGLAFSGLMMAGAGLLAGLSLAGLALLDENTTPYHKPQFLILAVVLIAGSAVASRSLAGVTRRRIWTWCGVQILDPYLPQPDVTRSGRGRRIWSRAGWLLADPSTWRDLLWMIANAGGGFALAAMPAVLVVYGLGFLVLPNLVAGVPHTAFLGHLGPWLGIPLGVVMAAAGLWMAPKLLPAYGVFARSLLAPTRKAELAMQVRHLAQTRSDTIDTGAAEMRRIERDLHDGAQARLVAMGMTLDAAEQLVDRNPAAARALLAEARESSANALAELRDLIRGIHPPVLADRGLAEAIRALALDMPLRVQVDCELSDRLPAPLESAAYFAVNELLANASKHARAVQAWVDIRHSDGMLRISAADDGQGGADPARGSGLRGIERRLAAFDGVIAVSSPPGGPTVVNMEIPCALSSPKTSSC